VVIASSLASISCVESASRGHIDLDLEARACCAAARTSKGIRREVRVRSKNDRQ
jgi:hypothetical protein